jgi:hypothetical protein
MSELKWEPIPGYEGYVVSEDGKVGSIRGDKVKILKQQSVKGNRKYYPKGRYFSVSLPSEGKFKTVYVHRIVLSVFSGPRPDGYEAEHINGDVSDNSARNLCWSKPSKNMMRVNSRVRKPDWDDQL